MKTQYSSKPHPMVKALAAAILVTVVTVAIANGLPVSVTMAILAFLR
jgi:hypothetical protein